MHDRFTNHWLTRNLSHDAKMALYEIGDGIVGRADDTILAAGEPNVFMYLLLEGACKGYLPTGRGRNIARTLGHRGPGDLLGEYSFMDSFRPTAGVTASTPGLMLQVGHEVFRKWLDSDADIASIVYRNILGYLVVRLRAQDEELACLMF